MKYPTISIVIATLNSERALEKCLKSIREQKYPQKKIEIILVDGGSQDKTTNIGKKYNCLIIEKKGVGAESSKAYGVQKANGELIADFGSDNTLPSKKWLQKLVRPLVQNVDIIGSYPLRYKHRKRDTLFNRYVALFGVNDPVPFYLGKADRQSYLYDKYNLSGNFNDKGAYYEVVFNENNLPTVGANGFIIRKSVLKKANIKPQDYFHIDVVLDVVKKGYNTFAVVKTDIVHDTAGTLMSLLKKRNRYFHALYISKLSKRRYHIFSKNNPEDLKKIAMFVIFSLTFIQPLALSVKGFLKKQDIAWFMHPVFCFSFVLVYGRSVMQQWVKSRL